MTTEILRLFCARTRLTFSSESAPNMSNWCPALIPSPAVLSRVSTKQRFSNSAYWPVTAA